MAENIDELQQIEMELSRFATSFESGPSFGPLERLKEVANEVGGAWSGSWLGYHANVYYNGLEPPPPGQHFNREWGLRRPLYEGGPGHWREMNSEAVQREIYQRAGNLNLSKAHKDAEVGTALFNDKKDALISILHAEAESTTDSYLRKLLDEANGTMLITDGLFLEYVRPRGQIITRDALAGSQGIWTPPHFAVLATVAQLEGPALACKLLATVTRKASSHLERTRRKMQRDSRIGTNVFIGHGGSKIWKELRDFVRDRLFLPWDEFNRVPVAGNTNIARLSEMLDAAALAFVVMTAEDEQADGKLRARMNVVHEAGLFQGRLGFSKAIVLLEEGCEEFSNIEGLGQIRFPRDNFPACFEEIRRVVEREGLIDEPGSSEEEKLVKHLQTGHNTKPKSKRKG